MSETARSAHERVFRGCLVSGTARSAHGRVCRGCLVSETARSAHGRVCRGCLVSETARSAHERVCQGCFVGETAHSAHGSVFRVVLVSETARSAHERVCRGRLVSETARSAHGRVFRGCLVSETARSAHGRVCRGCLVSGTACSAHGRVSQGRLVSETACSAHGRVCRCASGRRRVCVVAEESRHPYLRNSALHPRATKWYESVAQACLAALSGDDKCQKRCPGVSSWSGAAPLGDGRCHKKLHKKVPQKSRIVNLLTVRLFLYISSKKLFLSYVTGVKIADFYVSLSFETVPGGGARLGEGS